MSLILFIDIKYNSIYSKRNIILYFIIYLIIVNTIISTRYSIYQRIHTQYPEQKKDCHMDNPFLYDKQPTLLFQFCQHLFDTAQCFDQVFVGGSVRETQAVGSSESSPAHGCHVSLFQ